MKSAIYMLVFLACVFGLHHCNVEQPKGNPTSFTHATAAAGQTCESCHNSDRPPPVENYPHGNNQDCSVCHTSKDDTSGWSPQKPFNHVPKPASCLPCHIKERPVPPHPASGDCANCHNYPSFKP